jgi:hypothetical protein
VGDQIQVLRLPNGKSKKGHKRLGGRRKGTPNKYSRNVRESALNAAERLSPDHTVTGFLEEVGREHKATLANLLGKTMAPAKEGDEANPGGVLHITEIQVIGVPEGWQQLPDGVTYARWDVAAKIWREHGAQQAASAPVPFRPFIRVRDPDDNEPPSSPAT